MLIAAYTPAANKTADQLYGRSLDMGEALTGKMCSFCGVSHGRRKHSQQHYIRALCINVGTEGNS
jgi:hypothetical protein